MKRFFQRLLNTIAAIVFFVVSVGLFSLLAAAVFRPTSMSTAPVCGCINMQEMADLKEQVALLKTQVEEGRRDTLALANALRAHR